MEVGSASGVRLILTGYTCGVTMWKWPDMDYGDAPMKSFKMQVEEETLEGWKEKAGEEGISVAEWIRRRCGVENSLKVPFVREVGPCPLGAAEGGVALTEVVAPS